MQQFQDRVAGVSPGEIGLMDAVGDEDLDEVTGLVKSVFSVPVSLVSIVDAENERQVFKSQIGLAEPWASRRETPLTHSFCQYVVLTEAPLVVPDARANENLCANLAIADLGVIAYLGVPLRGPDGQVIGALCAIDGAPRDWSQREVHHLSVIGNRISREILLRAALLAGARLVGPQDAAA